MVYKDRKGIHSTEFTHAEEPRRTGITHTEQACRHTGQEQKQEFQPTIHCTQFRRQPEQTSTSQNVADS